MKNVFYFHTISSIGGCESWFWYLSKLYKDFVIYYKLGSEEQIKRLAKNVEVRKYKEGEIINCENFFCCYNPDILDFVNAKMYAHVIHCDYKKVTFKPIMNDKFDKYIAVSKLAGESFKEITGTPYELIYNPIKIDIPKVEKYNDGKLHLISATRLTKEKGLNRMIKLATLLDIKHIPYEWVVYTNRKRRAIGNNVIYKEQKMDILEDIAKADALVQLSDCEAFCFSIVESALVGTEIICTDLPVLEELGIKDHVNAYICDFNMNNVPINDIANKRLEFKYQPPKSEWDRYLSNKGDYNPKDKAKVRVKRGYTDLEIGRHLDKLEEVMMTKERISLLECKGLVERV